MFDHRRRDGESLEQFVVATVTVDYISRNLPRFRREQVAHYANHLAQTANAEQDIFVHDGLASLHGHLLANIAAYGDALHEGCVPLIKIAQTTPEQ